MSSEESPPRDRHPADPLFSTDLWPSAEIVADLLPRLHALLSSEGAVELFGHFGIYPLPVYTRPRFGFFAGHTADDVRRDPHLAGADDPDVPAGFARYECELTGKPFLLPFGVPVPCLLFDRPSHRVEPTDLPERSPRHKDEYAEGLDFPPGRLVVHPALIEAGPAHVVWAAWHYVEQALYDVNEKLVDLLDVAAAFAGMEPGDLVTEWPSHAYRRWEQVRREGEPYTYKRVLTGYVRAKE